MQEGLLDKYVTGDKTLLKVSFDSMTPDGLAELSLDCLVVYNTSTQPFLPHSLSCGQFGIIARLFSQPFLASSLLSLIGMSFNNIFACLITSSVCFSENLKA